MMITPPSGSLLRPPAPSSADAVSVASAFGVPLVRLQILRVLLETPSASFPQLARALQRARNGLDVHVEALEELGVIESFMMRTPGSYRPTRCYRLQPSRLEELAWCLFDAVIGGAT